MSAPRISALVVSYRHERFIAEALQSVLDQTGPEVEIVISDDASPDGTMAAIARVVDATPGRRILVTALPHNSGLASNLNHAVAQAGGDILVACAGDDRSRPQRFAKLAAAFADPQVFAVTTDAMKIDESGHETGYEPGWQHDRPIEPMAFTVPGVATNGASMAYRREVFDVFGPLDPGVNWEDQVLPFRAALLGRVAWLREALVEHRYHGTNMSMPLDWQRVTARDFVARWAQSAQSNALILAQKRRDLDRFLVLWPQRRAGLAPVAAELERWHNLQLLCGTVGQHPWRALGSLLALSLRRRISFRQAAKQWLMGRLPGLWLWHMRRRGQAP